MKKSFMLFIIVLFGVIGFAGDVFAEEVYAIISAEQGSNMTATANPDGMKVAVLKQGARVKLIRQEDSWSKVEYNGRLGWVRNESIKPFAEDLLPVYSIYYKLLEETEHLVYALVNDFTQDGIEDLYIIVDADPTKGQYIEKIYSGDTVIYQKNLKHGLTVLKDTTDYYLFHHTQTNSEKKFTLSELNDQAKTDYYEVSDGEDSYEIVANTYLNNYFIVQSSNGKLSELTFTHEQVTSKNYYGGEKKNEYDETVYLEKFSLSNGGKTKEVSEKEYEELFAKYERAKGAKVIYSDDYKSASLSDKFSFDLNRAKNELLNLASNVSSVKKAEMLPGEMEKLKIKLAQSVFLEMPYEKAVSRNAYTMVKNVEQGVQRGLPGYELSALTTDSAYSPQENMQYIDRLQIENVIRDFYGTTINAEEFNALASAEDRFFNETMYQFPLEGDEVVDDTYIYRQLLSVEQLGNGYDALGFADYQMPLDVAVTEANENALIAGKQLQKGYVVFKRLPFKSEMKWVYIDTISSLDLMDMKKYQVYENTLPLLQSLIAEEQIVEGTELDKKEEPLIATAATGEESLGMEVEEKAASWSLIVIVLALVFSLFGGAYLFYNKKIKVNKV
ncbi:MULTISPECIES: SH3 domain-containing protein [Solibacillus]|uniref:SH3 domain-containing protein n=1 Tax=Solibacillus merdavium TaxID=2762218 RepID=A0ABR8XSY1_9BACL|nr:SH3 domain-containing protein [Solibacillus merdavium]MBD8035047.1 SH3 domain-containing protein [Solibacillus merdavium]